MQKYSFSVKIQRSSSLFRARLWDGAVFATVDLMEKKRRAAVVVLGDIGRSPRMQFHALSLAHQADLEVDIVTNGGVNSYLSFLFFFFSEYLLLLQVEHAVFFFSFSCRNLDSCMSASWNPEAFC
ncbi:beta-1,4-mannosyltransferase protein [Dioscorea alata]|uniref:Beta-1,4-mannosyltransferase protein n=1 Tax=Dioscorea alata TaxID=55571 RepID=A0ACB7UXB6_DIOAL|nr:beta-1,4-mannosyltransferase protein [Dioscorea alata]